MVSIDKTYLKKNEYIQLRDWWIETKEQQEKELGYSHWMFPFDSFDGVPDTKKITKEFLSKHTQDIDNFTDNQPVWNTSGIFDLWLIKNCQLDFVQIRLKDQYSENYFGFKFKDKLNFSEKPLIVSIKDKGHDIYFFRTKGSDLKDGEVSFFNKVIFYGTTYFLKLIDDAIRTIEGHSSRVDIEIAFELYGLLIIAKGNSFFIDDVEIYHLPIFDFKKIAQMPKIKHSYKLSDSKNYHNEEVFVSHENECFDITMYKDFKRENLKHYTSLLPEYTKQIIT